MLAPSPRRGNRVAHCVGDWSLCLFSSLRVQICCHTKASIGARQPILVAFASLFPWAMQSPWHGQSVRQRYRCDSKAILMHCSLPSHPCLQTWNVCAALTLPQLLAQPLPALTQDQPSESSTHAHYPPGRFELLEWHSFAQEVMAWFHTNGLPAVPVEGGGFFRPGTTCGEETMPFLAAQC